MFFCEVAVTTACVIDEELPCVTDTICSFNSSIVLCAALVIILLSFVSYLPLFLLLLPGQLKLVRPPPCVLEPSGILIALRSLCYFAVIALTERPATCIGIVDRKGPFASNLVFKERCGKAYTVIPSLPLHVKLT